RRQSSRSARTSATLQPNGRRSSAVSDHSTPHQATSQSTAVPALQALDLSIRLHTKDRSMTIVDRVSWWVRAGETLAIVGESGSGKTVSTLGIFRLLPANVAIDTGGQVLLHGRDILGLQDRHLAAILGNQVGVVFQDPLTAFNPMRRVGPQ